MCAFVLCYVFYEFRHLHALTLNKLYMHACTHARMHACTHARMHACTHARMHACTHARMHACTHARLHACMHACTQARTHASKHTRTHASKQAHTHARKQASRQAGKDVRPQARKDVRTQGHNVFVVHCCILPLLHYRNGNLVCGLRSLQTGSRHHKLRPSLPLGTVLFPRTSGLGFEPLD